MRRQAILLQILVFNAGFATMSLELASVRALAPFFGASVFVWTNVLGIVLAALSLGYFVAGRLADRWTSERSLAWALLAGGGLAFSSPYLAQALASAMIPPELRLEDSFTIFWGGSLLVGALAFGPPAFLLSFSSPAAIRFLAGSRPVGEASGRIFALSTVGSILGTFLTTYLLVPSLGTQATFLIAGLAVLIPSGVLLLLPAPANATSGKDAKPQARGIFGLALLPWALGLAAAIERSGQPVRPWGLGAMVAEKDTLYQWVQLREQGSQRWIQVNEGLDSFQSLWIEGQEWTGAYYDFFLLGPALAEMRDTDPLRACVLGLGGGTASRLLEIHGKRRAKLEIDGVEIDSGLIELARGPFGLDTATQPGLRLFAGIDARAFLARGAKSYDLILLDAYAAQMHIPFHLASREFFELTKSRLAEGGVLAMNVGVFRDPGRGEEDPVLEAIASTAAAVFGEAVGVPVRRSRNLVLFCRRGEALPSFESLRSQKDPGLESLLAHAAFPGVARHWKRERPSGLILTDDRSPLETMQIRALAAGNEGSAR